MPSTKSKAFTELEYEYAAATLYYLHSLELADFNEATPAARQRRITLQSLELLQARRPGIQVFNRILVQYSQPEEDQPRQVVPDNMVVLSKKHIEAEASYDVPFQPAAPFWVLKYVSKQDHDEKDDLTKYEKELRVPYCLMFYLDTEESRLYRHTGRKYKALPPDEHGRHPLPELDLEVGLVDGWVRYWYKGELLPLPAEMQRDLDTARQQAEQARQQAEQAHQQVEELRRQLTEERQARQDAERQLTQVRGQSERKPRRNNGS